ncbi:hypothetical protein SAMN05892877_117143 [Rhizobium subbaraonis]|uniref:Uncharacterized protein n=1 Tax=Rhizobium subbaraonis TaxID=908946 RepID=A0A285UV47_9HYPH|nr:hypothetical protein [Rhizobium subbaraonis]SOC45754.1 hypothetical protein SAMN05892877_117143 [Rhizobium subbaraonis]
MARYNKIFLGPVEKTKPQVKELLAAAALKPGRLAVISSGKFALAGATTVGKVWLIQDNYLAMKGVDTDWAQDSMAIGIEMEDDHLYAARIANGVNITAVGTALTPGANGTLAIASTSDLVVAYSDEVYNNNSGSEQLLRIRPAGSMSYLSAAS